MARYKNKPNYSQAQKAEFVNKYLCSKMSKAAFCQQHNISDSSLYRWQDEQQTIAVANKHKNTFVPVSIERPQSETLTISNIEPLLIIKLAKDITIQISPGFDLDYLFSVIHRLTA